MYLIVSRYPRSHVSFALYGTMVFLSFHRICDLSITIIIPSRRVKEILAAQSAAPSVKQGPLGKFTDLLALYQALSLVVPMQPDLEIDPDLQVRALHVTSCTAG